MEYYMPVKKGSNVKATVIIKKHMREKGERGRGLSLKVGGLAHMHRLCNDIATIGPWAGQGSA